MKMMSDVDVLDPGVLNFVAAKSDDTLVVTVQRDAICPDNLHDLRLHDIYTSCTQQILVSLLPVRYTGPNHAAYFSGQRGSPERSSSSFCSPPP
ncbi:hypothetical protein Tco_0731863 [Tanacetum coccineum]